MGIPTIRARALGDQQVKWGPYRVGDWRERGNPRGYKDKRGIFEGQAGEINGGEKPLI